MLRQEDGMGEQAIEYFNRSVIKQRPMPEDEKENDGSKHPAGSSANLRQQIKRRKTQLIQSQGSSVIINDPEQQEQLLKGVAVDQDQLANQLNQRLAQLNQR